MSAGSAVSTSRSAPPGEGAPPPPLLAPTGNPGVDAVADVINGTVEPFQQVANPDLGTSERVAAGLNAAMGLMGAVPDLVDTGFAVLTAPLAKLFPALPAITLLGMHVGPPHTHTHPPSLTPPAPTPVPLPSIGMLLGAGAVTVWIGGLPAARCGDIGISVTCGSLAPPFEVYTGSSNVFIGGARAARMGDLTKHCNPSSGGKPGALDLIMNAAAATAGALGGNSGAIAQAAAETAMLGVKAIMGKDPGLPMLPGALLGPPVPNVLIGGFPCPALGDMAQGKLLGGLKKAVPKRKKKGADRKHGDPLDGSNAAQREANGTECYGGEPVYLVTGETFNSYVDYAPGGVFEWRRHYTSARNGADGPLGFGWRHFYQRSLRRRLHRATFTDWDGLRTEFGRFEPGTTATRANGYVFERIAPGHYRVRYRGRPQLEFRGGEFDDELPLVRVVGDGASLELEYDPLGRLVALVEIGAGTPALRYELQLDERGRITRLWQVDATDGMNPSSPAGAAPSRMLRAAYRYSVAGDLELARDSLEGAWRHEYDAFHRLTKQTDPRQYSFAYRYDAQGRCVKTMGQDGLWWCRVQYFPEQRFTRYTEGDNAIREFHYDSSGVVTHIVDPYGKKSSHKLDDQGRVTRKVDAGGHVIRWLYDGDGAHFARVDELGRLLPPELEPTEPIKPNDDRTASTPFQFLLGTSLDPVLGAGLDGDAARAPSVSPELVECAREVFPPRPAARWERVTKHRVSFDVPTQTLDPMGRVIRERDAVGRTRSWEYDATGNRVAEVDRQGRRTLQQTVSWNLLGKRINPLGHAMSFEYSRLAELTKVTDPLGNETSYDYDLKGRLARVFRLGRLHDEYVHDVGDRLVGKRDGVGGVLFSDSVDERQRARDRTLATGAKHRFRYDSQGRVLEASTDQHTVEIGYGLHGRRVRDLRDGQGVEHYHDGSGVRSVVLRRYEVRRRHAPDGAIVLRDSNSGSTRIEVGATGYVRRLCSNGTRELLRFDRDGRLEGCIRYRERDLYARKVSAQRYVYSSEGDLLQVTDSERGTTRYELDEAHRFVAEQIPTGVELRYPLDEAGNLRALPGSGELRLQKGNRLASSSVETFEYDRRNRLARRQRRDGSRVEYAYDSLDVLDSVYVRASELPVQADAEDQRVVSADAPWNVGCRRWRAAYDAECRRLWTQWNDENGTSRRRDFYWDGDRLAAEVLPDGTCRVYQYGGEDALSPLQFTDHPSASAAPDSGRTYHVFYNPAGMPMCIEDDVGHVVWRVNRVDPYGQLDLRDRQQIDYARPGSAIEYNLRWPGHYYDPETGLHYNRCRYYDPALGRYLQSDPWGYGGSPVNLYSYCPNPLVQVDVFGLHIAVDRVNDPNLPRGSGRINGREYRWFPAAELEVSPVTHTPVRNAHQVVEISAPDGTVVARYYLDAKGRTVRAEGMVMPPPGRKKKTPKRYPDDFIHGTDDRGHLITESLAADQNAVNVPWNIVAEHRSESNQSNAPNGKRTWERQAEDQATEQPGSWTVHEPKYDGDSMRPSEIFHDMYSPSGERIPDMEVTIPNPLT
jgi:RHS repeat-associated protein